MAATAVCLPAHVGGFPGRPLAIAVWAWSPGPSPAFLLSSPLSVNTCHCRLQQGQWDGSNQLKCLRDAISVTPGTSSLLPPCVPGWHWRAMEVSRHCVCVHVNKRVSVYVCVVCLIQPLGSNQLLLSKGDALEGGGRPTPFLR